MCCPYAILCSPFAGETENEANSAQLKLELKLSLAFCCPQHSAARHSVT
jgi:hypothetical protein